jgi:phosphoglycolate phosphatase-like HAD superfamily hydrolase
MRVKPIIALDADGVLLDYSLAYASFLERAFGYRPLALDKDAYSPRARWAVEFLEGERLAALRACMDEQFWSSVPPMNLEVEACHRLHAAGYEHVCVSALARHFEGARLKNLRDTGFAIERVIATERISRCAEPEGRGLLPANLQIEG